MGQDLSASGGNQRPREPRALSGEGGVAASLAVGPQSMSPERVPWTPSQVWASPGHPRGRLLSWFQ